MQVSAFRTPSINDATQHPCQHEAPDGTRTWITRATNFIVAVSQCEAGAIIDGEDLPDESMVFFPDLNAQLEADGGQHDILADSLVILPPGRARIVARGKGTVVRICSHYARALMAEAGNQADFLQLRPEVAPLSPWPAPPDGFRVRIYHLPSLTRPGDRMRIFRSSNLMVNLMNEVVGPRDVEALSPHAHADFEQASLAIRGRYLHHLRTPWSANLNNWREDQHVEVGAPSVAIIPAGIVHTSRNINPDRAMLVDVFAPPRVDMALNAAWSKNAQDYPLPPELHAPP